MTKKDAKAHSWAAICGAAFVAVACGSEPPCPGQRIGSQCRPPITMEEGPAGDPEDGGVVETNDAGCMREVCNGLDDDCDGSADEGVKVQVFVDADGDGKGAGAPMPGCPGPGASQSDDDCDDSLATRAPGLPELCDGVDNSCDSVVDEDLLCQPNQPDVDCMTSCGSIGKGTCSALCEVPSSDACAPPAEVCNGKDDDCDGATDQHLTARIQIDSVAQVPSDSSAKPYQYGQMVLTPAANGHANWFYRAGHAWGADSVPAAIQGFATERPNQLSSDVASRTADVAAFLGAGDEQTVVLVESAYLDGFTPGMSSPWSLRLQAFNAANLSFVSELIPAETRKQAQVVPLAASMIRSPKGQVHVLFAYTRPGPNGTYITAFQVAHLSPTGQWGQISPEVVLLNGPLRAVKVARIPCRGEFLVGAVEVTPAINFRTLRRVDAASGVHVGDEVGGLLSWASLLVGLGDGGVTCTAQAADEFLALYQEAPTEGSATFLQHLTVDQRTGAITTKEANMPLEVPAWIGTWAEKIAGRWFIATWTKNGERYAPMLWEHWLHPSGKGLLRSVALIEANNPKSADPGGADFIQPIAPSLGGLVPSSGGVLAAYANLTAPGAASSTLDKALAAIKGATPGGVAAAAYYRIGCP